MNSDLPAFARCILTTIDSIEILGLQPFYHEQLDSFDSHGLIDLLCFDH